MLPLPPQTLRRVPLLIIGIGTLILAMWGGLVRMGWAWPLPGYSVVIYHGPLMISGFLGTLLSLERAVALGKKWTFASPIMAGLGAVCILIGLPIILGQLLFLGSSLVLVVVFIVIVVRQAQVFTITMGLGAVCWAIGNLLWLAVWPYDIPKVVPWWIAFLVLTIVGERLELSRFLKYARGKNTSFILASGLYGLGVFLTLFVPGLGWALSGLGMLALAIWLSIYDIAWRTMRQKGMTGFVAACLVCGYFWLAVGGALAVYHAMIGPILSGSPWMMVAPTTGMVYDQIIHAVLLGFVMSMIFGHVLIIFPSVLGVLMRYSASRYLHVILLQLSVALRIGSDIMHFPAGQQWGGLFNAIAILLFLLQTILSVRFRKSVSKRNKNKPLEPANIVNITTSSSD